MPPLQLPLGKSQIVSELGWHRTAAGVRADVLSPRAHARPAQECPDAQPNAQLAMQDALFRTREDALAPVQALVRDHTLCLPPRAPVRLVAAQPGHEKFLAQVEAAATDA